jgi:hypothetical protein
MLAAALVLASDAGTAPPRTVDVAFTKRSYEPGERATIAVWGKPGTFTVQLFHVGPEASRPRSNDTMTGVPVGPAVRAKGTRLEVRAPRGRSGLYYAAVTGGGAIGYAPFVLRPGQLGDGRSLVVLPTNTWQAYNFRDVDGNGVGDTWYDDSRYDDGVDLTRPYLDRGVPPHYRAYDVGFLRWATRYGGPIDYLSDDDLERIDGRRLATLYDLVVFPGHEEYVTARVWDAIEEYRDRGGNLVFLSANTFFYRVSRRSSRIYKLGHMRDFGRPDAPLIGSEYVGWFEGRYRNRPFTVTGAKRLPWLFAGTGLRNGDEFGKYGIEVNQRVPSSPAGTVVAARIPGIFGPGKSAEMTYYSTKRGAKVFSAGAMNFGGTAEWPVVSRLLRNLWAELRRP